MTFLEWLDEQESFGLRIERLADDFSYMNEDQFKTLFEWLLAAYNIGKENAR